MPSALFISPKDSIILVGPVIVSQCRRRESGPVTHKEAYMEAWRMQQKQYGSEQRANEMCAQMAYECDPARAFQTAVEKLSRLQLYDTWSRNVSEANDADLHVPGCLFPLASMREQGARIATTTLPPHTQQVSAAAVCIHAECTPVGYGLRAGCRAACLWNSAQQPWLARLLRHPFFGVGCPDQFLQGQDHHLGWLQGSHQGLHSDVLSQAMRPASPFDQRRHAVN